MEATKPKQFLDYDKSLACIHCGLCLSSCPTYLETGNENDSPRGRIYLMRAVQDGRLDLGDTAVTHIDRCLGCRACEAVCPSGVHYGELLETTRDHIEHSFRRSPYQTFLRHVFIEKIFPYPKRMALLLAPVKLIRKMEVEHLLPKFAREAMSLIPSDTHKSALPKQSPAITQTARGRIGFVKGCVMSVMFGNTNTATVELLNRAGYDVVTPSEQECCGALYAHGGNLAAAQESARRNIVAFGQEELDAIVINAAGCGSTLKEYGHLLKDDPAWAKRGAAFSARVKDLSEFLVEASFTSTLKNYAGADADRSGAGLVTFHDACHLAHPQGITSQPRELVRAIAENRYVELPESDVCCGSAGSYNLTEPDMAARLQNRKVEHVLATGATTVVTTNPGCILQIQAGLSKAGASHIKVLHLADFLLSHLAEPSGANPSKAYDSQPTYA